MSQADCPFCLIVVTATGGRPKPEIYIILEWLRRSRYEATKTYLSIQNVTRCLPLKINNCDILH